MPTKPTVHMIGHGHIDPVWGWRWMEGCEEVRATFRSALELMKEFPDYHFTASSAAFYEWVREIDPELFKEIQAAVARGQWELAGGWWVEPDCNIPHGESFVRHGLYAQRFFMKHFGQRAQVGFNPDSFGHAGVLPQILRKQGMNAYCYLRPNAGHGEMQYPNGNGTVFKWSAKDGSAVLAANIPWSYGTWQWDILQDIQRHTSWLYLLPGQTDLLSFFGIGNHGGGPSRRNILSIQEAQSRFDHLDIQFSSLTGFFKSLEEHMGDSLPIIEHDLQFHAVGCYSAVSMVKQLNRLAEHQLLRAERLTVIDSLLNGVPSQNERIEELWHEVLFNQFHDILAGSSLEKAYEDVRNSQGKVLHEGLVLEDRARQRIASRIDTRQEGRSLVIFNPLPWERTEWVTATEDRFYEFRSEGPRQPIEILDDQNAPTIHTTCRGEFPGQRAIGFLATVPALGYRTYRAVEAGKPTEITTNGCLEAGHGWIENEFWRIELDPNDGSISSLIDRRTGVNILKRGMVWEVIADSSDTWSHGIRGYRTGMGRFGSAAIRVIQDGGIRVTLHVTSSYGKSIQETWLTLHPGLPMIDVKTRINWQEKFTCLKLTFDTKLDKPVATSESAYSYEERPGDQFREFPCQSWVDLSGSLPNGEGKILPYGFAILNDSHYAFDTRGSVVRITILRSPPYRHHDPDLFDPSEGWAFTDQGYHEFRYRLVPHPGSWREASIPRQAWELNEPLYLHQESSHPGRLPLSASFLKVDHPNVIASVLKCAEDVRTDREMVVRLYEAVGESAEVTIEMPHWGWRWKTLLGPNEIQTLKLTPGVEKALEVDLLEEPLSVIPHANR